MTPAAAQRNAIRFRMYADGASDSCIARKLKCTRQNVYKWRRRNGLPAHYAWPSEERRLFNVAAMRKAEELVRCHGLGMTDREMAASFGLHLTTVQSRRKRLGLKANKPGARPLDNLKDDFWERLAEEAETGGTF